MAYQSDELENVHVQQPQPDGEEEAMDESTVSELGCKGVDGGEGVRVGGGG